MLGQDTQDMIRRVLNRAQRDTPTTPSTPSGAPPPNLSSVLAKASTPSLFGSPVSASGSPPRLEPLVLAPALEGPSAGIEAPALEGAAAIEEAAAPAPPRRIPLKIDRSGFFTSAPRGSTKKLGKKLAARKTVAKKKSATKSSKKGGGTKRKRSDSAIKKGTKKKEKKEKKKKEKKKRKGGGKKRRLIAPDPPRFL